MNPATPWRSSCEKRRANSELADKRGGMEHVALWIVLLLAGILLGFLNRRVDAHIKAYEHLDSRGVRRCLHMLVQRGSDGAFMIFEAMKSPRFVQFSVQATDDRVIGLHSYFPDAPWSEAYFDRVGALAAQSALSSGPSAKDSPDSLA